MSETPVSLSQVQQYAQSTQEVVVPTEIVPLPSEGKLYPVGFPLANKQGVEIRSMTAKEEDILTSRALVRSGKVVGALLRSCIVDKSFDPDKMLVGDRNAVLIGIRISGYGPEYNIKITCPECSGEVKREINLTSLPIKPIPEDVRITPNTNEFTMSLSVSKKTVVFKLFTGEEEREILGVLERGRKSGMQEELVTSRLKMQIVEISGERDPQRIAGIVRNLPARDSRDLRKYIDHATPGVELKTPFTCDLCSYQGEVEVPLGAEFFWPES